MNLQLSAKNWHSDNDIAVRGYCFCGVKLLSDKDLLEYFSQATCEKEFAKLLQNANGIFAVIVNKPNFRAIAIDGTRIYPLYYSADKQIAISDNPHLLLNADSKIDKIALQEFLCSANVFEGKTLIDNIKQVKPFHYVVFENNVVIEKHYWQYCIRQGTEVDLTIEQLDKIFKSVFLRMRESIVGRMVVVPLSGGLDSRLIVCWLKKIGVENVVCYTIGRPENNEYKIAKVVAERLGYKHYFIDNTSQEYVAENFYHDRDFIDYCKFIGNFGNFCWLFEYFAVKWLKEKGKIDRDAVFIPGHSGDFIAGSHLVKASINQTRSHSYLTKAIMFDSFEYAKCSHSVYKTVKRYFQNNTEASPCTNYMSFILQNRLTHQINNSARVYEYLGFDVRLPFWDIELLEAFRKLPYYRLENCNFYQQYVNEKVFKQYELIFPILVLTRKEILRFKIKNRLKMFIPKAILCRKGLADDIVCEKELTSFMRTELAKKGKTSFLSYNDVMSQWYLEMMKEMLDK